MNDYQHVVTNGITRIIGLGSQSTIKLVKHIPTNTKYALKLISYHNCKFQPQIHQQLNHPNIIKLKQYFYNPKLNCCYLILQYAKNNNLLQYLNSFPQSQKPSKLHLYNMFEQILDSVKYLHSMGFIHRDIKMENILIDHQFHTKLCDFGLATFTHQLNLFCGTYPYMPPEMLLGLYYNHTADIWQLGILFYQLIQGTLPFKGKNAQQMLQSIKCNPTFSAKFTKAQIALVKAILKFNPKQRPSIKYIMHRIRQMINSQLQKKQQNGTLALNLISLQSNNSINSIEFPNRAYNQKIKFNKEKSCCSQRILADVPKCMNNSKSNSSFTLDKTKRKIQYDNSKVIPILPQYNKVTIHATLFAKHFLRKKRKLALREPN